MLELSGPTHRTRIESNIDSLFGDHLSADGQHREYDKDQLKGGTYTLKATPDLNDKAGTALTVSFNIVYAHSIQALTLNDADSDQYIMHINDGDEIDLAALPRYQPKHTGLYPFP